MTGRAALTRNALQFVRFGLVGASNTLVDFGVTNGLFQVFAPSGAFGLLIISVAACALATVNSYFLNRRYTFKGTSGDGGAFRTFVLVAAVGLVANTSVFLFLARVLASRTDLSDVPVINVAKLGGVVAALSVTFLGYRFGVFQSDAVKAFRERFRFSPPSRGLLEQTVILMGAALLVRLAFLGLSTVIYGDAVNYSWVAKSLAAGQPERVDPFWSSLFCLWQVPFHALGLSPTAAVVTSSLLPGVLLLWPVTWMARTMFGSGAAWIAGIFCVVHPRFVAYSCNGYAETFYLLAFVTGTACAIQVLQRGSLWAGLGWGASFGAFFCVRGEAVAAFLLQAVVVAGWIWRTRRAEVPTARRALAATAALPGALAIVVLYGTVSWVAIGHAGLLQKASNLSKQFSEQLDLEAAAKETYGRDGALFGGPKAEPSLGEKVSVLVRRYPRNLMYALERYPGVLLSPVILFLLLAPAFAGIRTVPGREAGLALLMTLLAFPLLFYPLIQVEPRVLFATLIPVHVVGAAGIVAFCAFVKERSGLRLRDATVGVCAALMLVVVVWRGLDLERQHRIHRDLASWVSANVPPEAEVVGCSYGWISNTGFLTRHRAIPRLWTEDPAELAPFVRNHGARWMILYEPYVEEANPALRNCFDSPPEGFRLTHTVNGGPGRRAHVFEIQDIVEGGG